MDEPILRKPRKGRGALGQVEHRYTRRSYQAEDDGWFVDGEPAAPAATQVSHERARSLLSHNDSPDLPFAQSINPFRGCEHGCVYCFARPTHAYLDLSPGLDFETKLVAKTNAAELLRAELARPGYRCQPIAFGTNTDPYQPIERTERITRQLLEILVECRHPFSIVTKNALVERDLDLIAPMAAAGRAVVYLSVTSLDNRLAARMEPRASAPHRRIEAIRRLHAAGVPVGVLVAPVIPALNDAELEQILEACREAGAQAANYILLRLPHELKTIFRDWLAAHYPQRAAHVMSLIQQMRGGRDNDPRYASRMRGEGVFAELIGRRFAVTQRRLGYAALPPLDCTGFRPPRLDSGQGELFV